MSSTTLKTTSLFSQVFDTQLPLPPLVTCMPKISSLTQESSYGSLFGANGEPGIVSASLTSGAGGAIADLLDLQSELSSLQRGLSEISKRTQSLQKQQSQSKVRDKLGFRTSFCFSCTFSHVCSAWKISFFGFF